MNHFSIARLGTSDAAKRVDQAAMAFQRQREAEAERRRPADAIPTAPPVAAPSAKTARQWAAEQVAAWSSGSTRRCPCTCSNGISTPIGITVAASLAIDRTATLAPARPFSLPGFSMRSLHGPKPRRSFRCAKTTIVLLGTRRETVVVPVNARR